MITRLTDKKVVDYLVDKLNKKEEERKSMDRCDNAERDYLDYKDKNQDEYRYVKLGQLEDIEDELGIDLITLFKVWNAVLKQEYLWTKYNNELDATNDIEIGDEDNGLFFIYFYWENGKHLTFCLNEYGKTWALTKEELL